MGCRSPSLTVDAIVEKNGEILLIKRKNPPFKGCLALPGGFVEYGESLEDAVKREVLEEAGVSIELKGLLGVYSDPGRDPRGHVVSVCYVASTIGKEKGGSDALEAKFFHIRDIDMGKLAFDHAKIIADYERYKDVL